MEMQVQTETGFLPAPALLSREIDNLAVLYGDSNDNEWNALAFQVNQVNRRVDRMGVDLPTLAPGGTLDFGYIGDSGHSQDVSSPGNDQLRIENDPEETIAELGIAVKPAGVLVAVENPSGQLISGVTDPDRLRGYAPSDSAFTEFGSIKSQHTYTDRHVPTTALSTHPQQGIVRIDKSSDERNNIDFAFLNQREDDAPLELLAWGAAYKVTLVEQSSVVRDIVFGDGYNRRVLTWGGLKNTSPKRPNSWRGSEVTITSDDVRGVLSGRGGGRQ